MGSRFSEDEAAMPGPDIETLLARFNEPLRGQAPSVQAPSVDVQKPAPTPPRNALPEPRSEAHEAPPAPVPLAAAEPVTWGEPAPARGLMPALAAAVLVPAAALAVLWWQDMLPMTAGDAISATAELSLAGPPLPTAAAQAEQTQRPEQTGAEPATVADDASGPEFALSSPDRVEAGAGDFIAFPISIDATGALPPRSIVAVTNLPVGASFSQGRPFGADGWSLRPDEIAGLRLRLPAKSDTADMHLELVAGDGAVLSQSKTQLSIAPSPTAVAEAAGAETTGAIASAADDDTEQQTAADLPPRPVEKPDVKVNTVKTVTIEPPRNAKPYDGGYGLGQPADEPETSGEWMETKTWVDMHVRAEQSSDTVKVAEGGLKVRVTGRDGSWVQVQDPKSATTGWIYDRFLKPADAPAQ